MKPKKLKIKSDRGSITLPKAHIVDVPKWFEDVFIRNTRNCALAKRYPHNHSLPRIPIGTEN